MTSVVAALIVVGSLATFVQRKPEPISTDVSLGDLVATTGSGVDYDYQPVDTPRDLASLSDVVVLGRLADVADGRQIRVSQEADRFLGHSVFKIAVDEVLAGDASMVVDGFVYVEVMRPLEVRVEDVTYGLPSAGRVVVFGEDRSEAYAETAIDNFAGRPSDAPILGLHPQGFVMESADGTEVQSALDHLRHQPDAWTKIASLDDLLAMIRG